MRHPMHTDFDWNDAPNMRVPGAPAEARRGRSSTAGMPRIPEVDWSQAPNVRDNMRQALHDAPGCGLAVESCTCANRPSGEQRTGDRASWMSAGQLGQSKESVPALDRAFQAPGSKRPSPSSPTQPRG